MKKIFGRKSQADSYMFPSSIIVQCSDTNAQQKVQSHPAPLKQQQHTNNAHSSRKHTSQRPTAAMPGFIRPELPPHVLMELRYACALLLKETGPSDEDYEIHVNQADPLETYKRDTRQIKDIRDHASASQTSLQLFPKPKSTRHQDAHILKDTTSSANKQARRKSDLDPSARHASKRLPDPRAEYPPRKDSRNQPRNTSHDQRDDRQPVRKSGPSHRDHSSRTAPVELPNTHSPRAAQHTIPQRTEHRSTMGSAHTIGSPTQASAADRPRMREKNSWAESDKGSQSAQEPRSQTDPWVSVNPDYAVVPTLHPTAQHPAFRPPSQQSIQQSVQEPIQEPSRPQSRAGSIFENLRDGFRDYVKPRPSVQSSRMQSRAESRTESRADSRASSRPASRSGSFASGGKNWLRSASNGLRRKSSWSSFRSNKGEDEDEERGRKDKRPDLNRSLPPLPGLDQYKEPKVHIASLMAVTNQPKATPEDRTKSMPPTQAAPKLSTQSPKFPPPHQPQSPISPPRSERSAGSRPRIPFIEDEPLGPQQQPRYSEEARWLEMEVQRRINAHQFSPALSNDGKPSGRHSPGYFAANPEKREEAIRKIARRPLPHDRTDSYKSHNSDARSLSALGFRERQEQRAASPLASKEGDRVARPATSENLAREEEEREEREGRGALQHAPDAAGVGTERGGPDMRPAERTATDGSNGGGGGGGTPQKKGLKNRLSRLLGSHGNQARAVVAN